MTDDEAVNFVLFSISPIRSVRCGVPVRWMLHWRVSIMNNLVSDFRFGQLEDHHGPAENQWQEAQSQGFPRLQSDQCERERYQSGRFELETKQERYHYLLNKTTTWKFFINLSKSLLKNLKISIWRKIRFVVLTRKTRTIHERMSNECQDVTCDYLVRWKSHLGELWDSLAYCRLRI